MGGESLGEEHREELSVLDENGDGDWSREEKAEHSVSCEGTRFVVESLRL